ncbi:molecular chaperone TorD family protein [Thioalkalicoccus limnaeus]|uniref:Molecular chaperone TorD family protein n=1 Tax=Thioalkalicoccus limnaeus TaxID=120681 RepID=A0ABV4B953_9GAMM
MSQHDILSSKLDFYLCLARAFAIPDSADALPLLREALPADLAELAPTCGYPIDGALHAYRQTMAKVIDHEQLRVAYSRLFLVPGEPHPNLNTGAYLDGTLNGGSVTALETCYRRCGLERDRDFHDLPDHISVQLEFVARLFAAEAQALEAGTARPPIAVDEFLARFVARWIGPLHAEIEEASRRFRLSEHPYLALTEILRQAIVAEVGLDDTAVHPDPGPDPEIARLRSQYAGRTLNEADLAIIRQRLAADGLPTDHVAIPIDERDRTMGLATMTPPAPPNRRLASRQP